MRYVATAITALLVFAVMVTITPAVRAAPTQRNGFDNFDSYSAGLLPGTAGSGDGGFYTYTESASGCEVTNAQSQTAPNSVIVDLESAGTPICRGNFEIFDSLCNQPNAVITFNWRFNTLTAAHHFGVSRGTGTDLGGAGTLGFQVLSTGAVNAFSRGTAGALVAGSTVPGFTAVVDTWYEATISGVGCTGANQMIVSFGANGASTVIDPTMTGGDLNTIKYVTAESGGATGTLYLDNLRISGVTQTIAETAVVCKNAGGCGNEIATWTGDLVGFDVDAFGNIVMIRTQESASAGNVRALNPSSLAQIGAGPYDTECNRPDGVMSLSQYPPGQFYTGFTGCHTAASTVDTFHIRSGNLGDPDFTGTQCAEADFCEFSGNVDLTGTATVDCVFGALPTTPVQIENVVGVPISFREGFNPASSQARRVYVGFAYTNVDAGTVGFWVTKLVNNNDDKSCRTELPFAPAGTQVNSFCGIRYLNQTISPTGDFLGAMASGGTGGKFWSVRVTNLDEESQSTSPTLEMNSVGPTLPNNNGMGCSGTNDVLTIGSTGQVIRWHIFPGEDRTQPAYVNGVPHYPQTATPGTSAWTFNSGYSPPINSIAMDHTGNWGAYVSSATGVTVINATTGTAIATVTMPSGTYHSMFLSRNGQNLYIATEDEVARYDLTPAVGVLCPICNPDGSTQNTDGTTSFTGPGDGGGAGGTAGSLVGALITPFLGELGGTANLILGLIIILIFLGIGFVIIRKRGNPS